MKEPAVAVWKAFCDRRAAVSTVAPCGHRKSWIETLSLCAKSHCVSNTAESQTMMEVNEVQPDRILESLLGS